MTLDELIAEAKKLQKAGEGQRIVIVGIGDYVRSSASEIKLDSKCQVLIK